MALSAPRIFHPSRVSCAAASSNSLPKSTRVLFASLASFIASAGLPLSKRHLEVCIIDAASFATLGARLLSSSRVTFFVCLSLTKRLERLLSLDLSDHVSSHAVAASQHTPTIIPTGQKIIRQIRAIKPTTTRYTNVSANPTTFKPTPVFSPSRQPKQIRKTVSMQLKRMGRVRSVLRPSAV